MDNNNHVDMEKILNIFKRMNIEINAELLTVKQQSNRRLLAMETKMDSIEKKYASLEKNLRNFVTLVHGEIICTYPKCEENAPYGLLQSFL